MIVIISHIFVALKIKQFAMPYQGPKIWNSLSGQLLIHLVI